MQNIPKDLWKGLIVTLKSANFVLLNNSSGWNSATYCHKFNPPGLLKHTDKNISAHGKFFAKCLLKTPTKTHCHFISSH